ncbi:MAG: hypothetical protein EA385_01900 [Salinarimonadaceae bacterium]|nr:MAG: hypothetical protein EA385_01900 [Salinarimonadaceae bacterium]
MNVGSVFFDGEFEFHDGETGEKLFVVIGNTSGVALVSKTTSKQRGKGTAFGCQHADRFPNFYLPPGCCYLKTSTWVCLDEFYELNFAAVLQKRFQNIIKFVCTLEPTLVRQIQECASESLDITDFQRTIVGACLVTPPAANNPPTSG